MIDLEDIRQFLPTYLSQGSYDSFLDELKQFIRANSKPFYTTALRDEPILFQGDGLQGLLVINPPDTRVGPAPAILLSNTCDVDPNNQRMFGAHLSYAPIFSLERYLEALRPAASAHTIDVHRNDIRQQLITQIFFLPEGGKLKGDSIVFLDRTMSSASESVVRERVPEIRLFTLSNFGAWLFALKLSIHFCRIRDKVDRDAGVFV